MTDQVQWQLSGDYFENCNCSIVCPCLVSAAAPLTSKPTEGFCNVPLLFHIDSGRYGDVALDGLNVAVMLHARVMAEGLVGGRLYRSTRRRQADRGAGCDLYRSRRRTHGCLHAADQHHAWGEQGPDHLPDRRQDALSRNPRHFAHVRRSLPTMHPSGEMWANIGHPVSPDRMAMAVGAAGNTYNDRGMRWDNSGERPLRLHPLVEPVVTFGGI